MIDIATEVFEKSIKECQNTVYHFIKNNKWFIGKIYLLATSESYPSVSSIDSIRKIYNNVEIVNTSSDSKFIELLNNKEITRENIWKYSLLIDTYRLLYMSNYVIVSNDLSQIITESNSFISDNCDFIYLNGNRATLSPSSDNSDIITFIKKQTNSLPLEGILIYSSTIPDRIYASSLNLLKNSSVIVFDTLTSNFTASSRVNSVRLHKVRETLAYLTSPSAKIIQRPVYTPIPKSGAVNNITVNSSDIPVKSNQASVNPKINLISLADFKKLLDNKTICLVANSSDLLTDTLGEYIDSHDIVIRFNSYVLDPVHTGTKITIHASIYLESVNLENKVDYRIIISNSKRNWVNRLNSLDPSLQLGVINVNWPLSNILNRENHDLNKVPTTGFNVILLLYELINYKSVTLVGFTFYKDGIDSIYRVSTVAKHISKVHNYSFEEKWINSVFTKKNNYIYIHEKSNSL